MSGVPKGPYEGLAKGGNQAGHTSADALPRLGARLIDTLPFAVIFNVLRLSFDFGYALPVVETVVIYAYFVLLDTYAGTTLGKRLLGLRVTGPTGDKPEAKEAAIREAFILVGAIPFIGALLLGPIVWIAIVVTISNSPTKQGKHDQIAGGTRVVKV